jgi:hypothetical protein
MKRRRRGACLACEAVGKQRNIAMHIQSLSALYVVTFASPYPRALLNPNLASSLALFATASQARHAPRRAIE